MQEKAINIIEDILRVFEGQIGRRMPEKENEARQFLQNLYATEGSSLVLARILFVRFFEDHDMTIRKISNGGIRAFRQYHRYLKTGKCGSILTTIFCNYEKYEVKKENK